MCTGTQIAEQGKQRAWSAASGMLSLPAGGGERGGEIVPWDLSAVSRESTPISSLSLLQIISTFGLVIYMYITVSAPLQTIS